MTDQPVDIGGTSYTVRYNPNLSLEARQAIDEFVNKSASANGTDIYDMEAITEALDNDNLIVPDKDEKVLRAIEEGYIEIA